MRAIGLIVALGLAFAPLTSEAQQPGKIYRIGYLSGNPQADTREAIKAFIEALRDLGFVEGRNLVVDHRYADGQFDQLPRLVEELIREKADVIGTFGTPATLAAKNATETIPVVFGAVADPIVAGFVRSLPRPGGNVTGTTTISPELSGKRLALLKEALQKTGRIAILDNPNFPPTPGMIALTRTAAVTLHIQVRTFEARTESELAPTFKAIATWKEDALDVLPDAMFVAQHRSIVELAGKILKIPTIYHFETLRRSRGTDVLRPKL